MAHHGLAAAVDDGGGDAQASSGGVREAIRVANDEARAPRALGKALHRLAQRAAGKRQAFGAVEAVRAAAVICHVFCKGLTLGGLAHARVVRGDAKHRVLQDGIPTRPSSSRRLEGAKREVDLRSLKKRVVDVEEFESGRALGADAQHEQAVLRTSARLMHGGSVEA